MQILLTYLTRTALCLCSGYVFLAVSTPDGEVTKLADTEISDRQTNMVLFAEEALKLFLEVLTGATVVDKVKL